VALAIIYLVVQLAAGPAKVWIDSYDYGRVAYGFLGESPEHARDKSIDMLCADEIAKAKHSRRLDPLRMTHRDHSDDVLARCHERRSRSMGSRDPRYNAIFESRPGYPFMASVFARLVGMRHGLWAVSLASTIASASLVLLILRRLALPTVMCLAGAALFLVLPTGSWSMELLSEGSTLTGTLAVVLGSVLLVQHRIRSGLAISVAGYAFLFAVKNSQSLLLAALGTLAALATVALVKAQRHRGLACLAILSLGAATASAAAAAWLGWPGATESVQDTFTGNFRTPDVGDPWRRLAILNAHYWPGWVPDQVSHPLFVISVVAALWALWRWQRAYVFVIAAAGATGMATAISHPVARQVERLMVPVWLLVVLGVPVALQALAAHRPPDPDPADSIHAYAESSSVAK
jgi:hypothetical protein